MELQESDLCQLDVPEPPKRGKNDGKIQERSGKMLVELGKMLVELGMILISPRKFGSYFKAI
jgi:hypothetical protein